MNTEHEELEQRTIASRQEVKAGLLEWLRERLTAEEEAVPGGEWAGMKVVPHGAWLNALDYLGTQPLPANDLHGAEVTTPAWVLVAAICPTCHESTPIPVQITPELRVEDDGATLHLKAKAKGRDHVCGQRSLVSDDEPLTLSDILGVDVEVNGEENAE